MRSTFPPDCPWNTSSTAGRTYIPAARTAGCRQLRELPGAPLPRQGPPRYLEGEYCEPQRHRMQAMPWRHLSWNDSKELAPSKSHSVAPFSCNFFKVFFRKCCSLFLQKLLKHIPWSMRARNYPPKTQSSSTFLQVIARSFMLRISFGGKYFFMRFGVWAQPPNLALLFGGGSKRRSKRGFMCDVMPNMEHAKPQIIPQGIS